MSTQFSDFDDDTQAHGQPSVAADEAGKEAVSPSSESGSQANTDDSAPIAPKARASRASNRTGARQPRPRKDGIIELRAPGKSTNAPATSPNVTDDEDDRARGELQAQGFTADEAARIVDLSARLSVSREARDAEASLRRLRFTRWLVERGVLDEFSA